MRFVLLEFLGQLFPCQMPTVGLMRLSVLKPDTTGPAKTEADWLDHHLHPAVDRFVVEERLLRLAGNWRSDRAWV